MRNSRTVKKTSHLYFGSPAFRAGWSDVQKGSGFRPAYETWGVVDQHRYERARQMALATGAPVDIPNSRELKDSDALLAWLVNTFYHLRDEGTMA